MTLRRVPRNEWLTLGDIWGYVGPVSAEAMRVALFEAGAEEWFDGQARRWRVNAAVSDGPA